MFSIKNILYCRRSVEFIVILMINIVIFKNYLICSHQVLTHMYRSYFSSIRDKYAILEVPYEND